ncbi:protein DpdH [Paraburkholderia terrae]|uniref:protein DpdH n=1 Tax=Paraburkholderia terrae TaxID=311230 RepID=UPI001EE2C19E|nr:protein DpdH [Paraburkholderia terrae]GJG99177.1 ATP-binding protein [Paraburkholderia terrae]
MNPLTAYWPDAARVAECMRTEAETVDQALLLAVHQPVTLRRRIAESKSEEAATEHDLLNALMRPIHDGSSVIVALTGASGVGKSHMVRWLGAQLDRHPQRDRMVVVSIPKTASLRKVVELILEPLSGDEYRQLTKDLGRAIESMEPGKAAELLGTALAEELEPYAKRLMDETRAARDHMLGPRITAARHLRELVRDPDIRDRWFGKVLLRIVTSSLSGTADPALRQFQLSDFEPPESVGLGTALRDVVSRALAWLTSANGANRTTAAEVLQDVLDPALRTIFRFTESLRQRTIQEVVNDIRAQLLKDDKELILLIEDLAALSGIQQPLLDIMISESDEKGVRVRAPIRTAVAVTDGFLSRAQTVLTRAKAEWVVPSEGFDETAVVQMLVELTGRYLNAARWGIDRLKQAFDTAEIDLDDLYGWVPNFDTEHVVDTADGDRLAAFGRSQARYSLFPFNEFAIRSLATSVLMVDGRWKFNPRAFINEVLTKTLTQLPLFEQGHFPPANFRAPELRSDVRMSLQLLAFPSAQQGRVESMLYHWAGNPRSLSAPPLVSADVFQAFDLPWPFGANNKPVTKNLRTGTTHTFTNTDGSGNRGNAGAPGNDLGPLPINPPPPIGTSEDVTAYGEALEAWKPNIRLVNDIARRTRNLLGEALNQRLEFSDWCLQGQKVDANWFWLPPASNPGNPTAGLSIEVSPPDEKVEADIVAGLKALDRWDIKGKTWNYAGAENDYAAADVLLDVLERKTVELMLIEASRDVNIAAQALHRQNLLLGVTKSADTLHLKDLLADAPAEPAQRTDFHDAAGRKALEVRGKATRGRAQLQDRLRKYLSCYQGKGAVVMAVDSERFRQALKREVEDKWVFALKLRSTKDKDKENEDVLDALERLSPRAIDVLLRDLGNAVERYLPGITEAFAEDHARVAWREELKEIVNHAKRQSVWPSGAVGSETVLAAIERLSVDGIETTIQRLHKMRNAEVSTETNRRLAALTAVQLPKLIAIHEDATVVQHFLVALNKNIDQQTGSIDDEAAIRAHDALIAALSWEQ